MVRIVKIGEYSKICSSCGCQFSFTSEDIKSIQMGTRGKMGKVIVKGVRCPCCDSIYKFQGY